MDPTCGPFNLPKKDENVTSAVRPPTNASHLYRSPADTDRSAKTRPVLTLHGSNPDTGIPATWHVTPLSEGYWSEEGGSDESSGAMYLIERADGDIHSPALWMQSQREAAVATGPEFMDLVRSIMWAH